MSNKEIIIDRSAWKIDDPEWVKARKRQWRDIRRSLEYDSPVPPWEDPFYYVKKKQHKRLREYFLTGTITTNYPKVHLDPKPNHPLRGIEAALLLYIWLHADTSEENWAQLREKLSGLWYGTQSRFFESIGKYPPDIPLFGDFDFEKRLYDFFCARQGPYAPRKEKLQAALGSWIDKYLRREHHTVKSMYTAVIGSRKIVSYPNHIVRHGLNDYVDCSWELLSDEEHVAKLRSEHNISWDEDNALEIFFMHLTNNIASCYFALEVAEENDPIYAEVAQTLLDLMQAKHWPPVAQHVFEAGKAQAQKELQAKP